MATGPNLSVAEEAVLELLRDGKTYREAADALCVSLNTVKTHVKHIYAKLDVRNKTAAAAWYAGEYHPKG
jgi:DNA-binding CsgD family transcriptional regulator